MLISIILVSIWVILMLRSGLAEYKYYQSVKSLEPEIWEKLGPLKFPLVFVSSEGSKLLRGSTNKKVCELANKHRHASILFLSYVVVILVGSIVYFKIA